MFPCDSYVFFSFIAFSKYNNKRDYNSRCTFPQSCSINIATSIKEGIMFSSTGTFQLACAKAFKKAGACYTNATN